jgi:hypothetical protein
MVVSVWLTCTFNRTLNFQESQRTPNSPFRECESHSHTLPKVGLRHAPPNSLKDQNVGPKMKQRKNKIIGACSLTCNTLKVGGYAGL